MPTLIVHGTGDKTVPIDASARAAAKGIRQSKLIEYDGAAHGLIAIHKERFKTDLDLTAINITDKYALYNFLSTFSGTHYVTPRALTAKLTFNF